MLPLLGPQGAGRADFAAAQLKHRVHSVRAHLELVHIPTEEIAVEGDAGGLIGRGQLGPAEGSGWKRVEISHLLCLLAIWNQEFGIWNSNSMFRIANFGFKA